MFEDGAGAVRSAYNFDGESKMILVRPDLYVGYVGPLQDVHALSEHMQRWMT